MIVSAPCLLLREMSRAGSNPASPIIITGCCRIIVKLCSSTILGQRGIPQKEILKKFKINFKNVLN